jgi:class 3 adenylate cyclase
MACGGLKLMEKEMDGNHTEDPAKRTVRLAVDIMNFAKEYTYKAGKKLSVRIGVHYGTCIFGVLGYHKPQFSLIGDTINTTSRHCTTAEKDQIILSVAAYDQVKGAGIIRVKVD